MSPMQMFNLGLQQQSQDLKRTLDILSSEHSMPGSPKNVPLKEVKKIREINNLTERFNKIKKLKSLGIGGRQKQSSGLFGAES